MSKNCELRPLIRLRYFTGQLLTANDFQQEQQYFLEKHRRHNRCLHGYGVVSGLETSVEESTIHVDPGIALNCLGEEIAVCNPVELRLPRAGGVVYVVVGYVEKETDPVPVPGQPASSEGNAMQNSRIEEGSEITLESKDPCAGHKRQSSRWLCCGTPHAIPLAKLTFARNQWSIDRRFRRPLVRS